MNRRALLGAATALGSTGLAGEAAGARKRAVVPEPPANRKALNLWAFAAGTPVRTAMARAKAAGFGAVELVFDEAGEIGPQSTLDEMRALATEAHAQGLAISSLATALLWERTLSSDDPAVRAQGKAVVRKMLELAQALGTDTILVVPGVVGRAMSPELKVGYEAVWQRSQTAFRELAQDAGRRKVVIAVENVWNRFLMSPMEMRRYLAEIGSPWVKAYLDVGNVLRYGYPQDWVRVLGPLIQRVHVKDYKLSDNKFVALGSGDVPWKAVAAAFQEVGYRGYLVAEVGPSRPDPDAVVRESARALDEILAL